MKRNSLVDGWRGLSVSMVVVGHTVSSTFSSDVPLRPLHELGFSSSLFAGIALRVLPSIGTIGVQIFFVISGFLITTLFLEEEAKDGRISISAFYVRRAFRIIPAFAIFVAGLLLLRHYQLIHFANEAVIRSSLFSCNISGFACSWWLGHTWSLSAEEQYYLVWPLLFILLGKFRERGILLLLALITIIAFKVPEFSAFSYIAIGALVSISSRTQVGAHDYVGGWLVTSSAIVLILTPLAHGSAAAILSASGPLLTAVVFFGTLNGAGPFVAVARFKSVQAIGLISYSVYLWQQLGTAPEFWNGTFTGASSLYSHISPALFIVPAILSYFLVEQPFIRLGRNLSNRVAGTPPEVDIFPSFHTSQDHDSI